MQKIRPQLKEFHTRAQKKAFQSKLSNVTKIVPSVAELIYKEPTLDASASNHPATQERLRLIFLGQEGLLGDLRHLNPGRPSGIFDVFFDKLAEIVEEVTAADERRQNVSHLFEWISIADLMKRTEEKCPPGTKIPSASLVRLQFAPRNPYTHAALNFTSRIQVQYKIQKCQLRTSHSDDHYCAAQLKYLKMKAIEMEQNTKVALFFCDDKAKVPVGEPGVYVSTAVRGKKSIAPTGTVFVALDHDMTMASLTLSVFLSSKIPDSVEKSFLRSQVTTVITDSVFQLSNPFRHATALVKVMEGARSGYY